MRRWKVIVVLDQRVFRRKHKKPHRFTLGAVVNPLGHGPSPLVVVVPTFSTAEELFAGQKAFIRGSRSGWCMIGLDSADVVDVADLATSVPMSPLSSVSRNRF